MQKFGALSEILGAAGMTIDRFPDGYDERTAQELIWEAGTLVRRLGARALELLDAEAAAKAAARAGTSRKRTTTPRAIRLCTQVAGVEKES